MKKWISGDSNGIWNLTPNEVKETYAWVQDNVLSLLPLKQTDYTPIGSYGKKREGQTTGDIDIAIDEKALDMPLIGLSYIDRMLQQHGFIPKVISGLSQVSVAVPLQGSSRAGFVQVDLMLTNNLEWTKFAYHSPDFTKYESKYKGAVRTILLMAIISESTRNILSKTEDGHTIEVDSMVMRLNEGIYLTRRTFQGKNGILKKAKLMKEHDRFITDDPEEAVSLILGPEYMPNDARSFESIWKIINRTDFMHKDYMDLIMNKFIHSLEINGLDIPKEVQ